MLSEAVQIAVFEFFSAVIVGAAWPVVAGILVWQQRAAIGRLIDRFRALGFGDLKADFGSGLEKAEGLSVIVDPAPAAAPAEAQREEAAACNVVPPETTASMVKSVVGSAAGSSSVTGRSRQTEQVLFDLMVNINPSLAIADTWAKLEGRLRDIRDAYGSTAATNAGLLLELISQGLMTPPAFKLYNELEHLKTTAMADPDLSVSDAVRFRNVADSFRDALDLAAAKIVAKRSDGEHRATE